MKKRNWKFILPPPVLAAFLFMACNLIQEMPKDFVETYGNIAYVESVEYVGLAEEGGDKPKVTETKNFKIIYHIKNDGDFDLSPEFSFEGCEIKNPHVDTGKKRVSLTIAGEELKALDNGKEFKVKLTLYKASQKVLQSSYEIGMRYVYTGGPEIPTGTVKIPIQGLNLPEGYELSVKDSTEFKAEKGEDGSWIITTIGSGVAEGKYELELVVKDEEGKEIGTIKKEIKVSAGNPTAGFTEKDDEKSLEEFIDEVEKKIDEIEKNPPKNPDDDDKGDDDKGGETKPETPLGKVEITIPVHGGYTLEIDGENKDKFEVVPNGDGSYTITTKEEGGVPEGKYELELVVKDEDENEVKSFNKTVEVSTEEPAGNFAGDDEPFEITEEMIEKTTVYVRGKDAAWYDVKHPDDAKASDDNLGARLKPFATIQKAVDTIIARNADDDSEPYTIYVDGKLTQNEAPSGNKKGMADFSELEKGLKLTIKSLSDTKATLNANKQTRVLYVKPKKGNLILMMKDIVIENGINPSGGYNGSGIYFENVGESMFKMEDCTVRKCKSTNGGGVYVSGGMFEMKGCTLSNNEASHGGAIFVTESKATISETIFSSNAATQNGGGVYVTDSASEFTMTGCTISEGNAKLGGGVYVDSNAKFIMNNSTTTECSITGNTASQNGGGVYVSGGTFEMKGGKISSNKSKVEGKADSNGGGVYVYAGGTFTMSGGNIGGNTATKDGGGVYVTGGTSKFTMTGGKIGDENTANTAQNGGGIYIAVGSTFTMSGGEITGNKAIDGDAEYHGQGGGVYVYSAKFEISGAAKIIGNTAVKSGGGIYIFKDSVTASATLTMTGGTISGNTATNNGGGVYVAGGTLTMSGGTIGGDKNKAENGGGVYVENGIFTMSKGTISNNEAKNVNNNGDGGGVYVKNTKFEMSDTAEISRNNAGYSGGGVYLDGNTFTMNGDAIVDNNTATYGGGVYVSGSTFTLRKGTISNNTARGNGGGVNVYGNKFIMEDGTISGNKAVYRGGGVLLRNSATTFMMNGGEISKNEITDYYNTDNLNGGGGVYVDSGTFTMSNGTISENKINHNGGGNGKGAFISSTFNMSGNAKFNKDDDVYLVNANMIHIAGTLNKDDVAKITPNAYTKGRQVLSVDAGVTMDETLCNKLFSITPDNGTKWKISYDNSSREGVLKKDNVDVGNGGGISVTLPDLGTYTFVVKSNGTPIADNDKITSGNDIILEKVTDSKGAEVNGTVTIELQDTSGKILKSNDSNSKTLNVPSYSFDLEAQVYVKVVLKDGNVIEKPIRVTIEPKPNS